MGRTYRMSRKECEGFLEVASEQVPFGIYAVEKGDYAELRHDRCRSITQLKAGTGKEPDGDVWYKVTAGNLSGYVWPKYVE